MTDFALSIQSLIRNEVLKALRLSEPLMTYTEQRIAAEQPLTTNELVYTPQIVVQNTVERAELNRQVGDAALPRYGITIMLYEPPAIIGPVGLSDITPTDRLDYIQQYLDSYGSGGKLPNPNALIDGHDWLTTKQADYTWRAPFILPSKPDADGRRNAAAIVFPMVLMYPTRTNPKTGGRK